MTVKPIREIPSNKQEQFKHLVECQSQRVEDFRYLMQMINDMEAPKSEKIILIEKLNKMAAKAEIQNPYKADEDILRRLSDFRLIMRYLSRSELISDQAKRELIKWLERKSAELESPSDSGYELLAPQIKEIPNKQK
ncbi:MAG: hypothetical protein ABIH87_02350 [bacterium]